MRDVGWCIMGDEIINGPLSAVAGRGWQYQWEVYIRIMYLHKQGAESMVVSGPAEDDCSLQSDCVEPNRLLHLAAESL